jgi:hypothetical protein
MARKMVGDRLQLELTAPETKPEDACITRESDSGDLEIRSTHYLNDKWQRE